MVKAYSGSYYVFDSGLIFSFSVHDDFKLVISPSASFTFNLIFQLIENDGERNLQKKVEGNNMYFVCQNFGSGAGTNAPIEIATADGKKMFIHFWIETIDSSRQVHSLKYTLYMES